jgi:hypothetical protein
MTHRSRLRAAALRAGVARAGAARISWASAGRSGASRERIAGRRVLERELTVTVVTIVGVSRLLDGPLLWVVAALVFAAMALGVRQVLLEGATGYAPVSIESSLLPAVLAAGAIGAVRLVPIGVALIPAVLVAWLLLDVVTRLEARVFDRPSGTTAEDRTALVLAGLAAGFVAFAGIATFVAGGLSDPSASGGTAITEAGIVTIAMADGVVASLIGFRLASTRLAGARDALWAAATYGAAVAIAAGLLRVIAMPRLAFPALLTLVFYLWDTLRGTAPSLRRDPRFIWQSVLLVVLGVAVVAWNLGLRGS